MKLLSPPLACLLVFLGLSAPGVNAQTAVEQSAASLTTQVDPTFGVYDPAVRLAQSDSFPADDPLGTKAGQQTASGMPPGARKGLYQGAGNKIAYLPRFENDSLGITTLETHVNFGVPFPRPQTPLLITPRYRIRFLDGPDFTDVPPRVHEAEVGLQHFRPLTDRWMFNGAITMGLYADDHSFDADDAFRVTGRALGIYELSCQWKGIIGVVYLNRAGLTVVPAAGLMYDRGDLKVDLIFPRPRVAWLLPGSTPGATEQNWFYIQGELGGNIWAVNRVDGSDDNLSYGDARLMIGYEHKHIGGVSQRTELAYVFNRELEYDSEGYESELDDTLMLRWISTF